MSDLQKLGKRLDTILTLLKQEHPDLVTKFENHILPRFIQLIDSNTSLDLENRMIQGLNGWIDLLELELKGIFEIY
jgi:hypothetical protein